MLALRNNQTLQVWDTHLREPLTPPLGPSPVIGYAISPDGLWVAALSGDALASYLRSLGGTIETGAPVMNVDELPAARAVLCDLTPRQLLRIAGHKFRPSLG